MVQLVEASFDYWRARSLQVTARRSRDIQAVWIGSRDTRPERPPALEAITDLDPSVASNLCPNRTGNSTVVQLDVVEERIGDVAVAIVGAQECPGEVGMIEHIEKVKAPFQLVTFERKSEAFVQAQIHRVSNVTAERVPANDPAADRRIDDVSNVSGIHRVAIGVDITGRRTEPK